MDSNSGWGSILEKLGIGGGGQVTIGSGDNSGTIWFGGRPGPTWGQVAFGLGAIIVLALIFGGRS